MESCQFGIKVLMGEHLLYPTTYKSYCIGSLRGF